MSDKLPPANLLYDVVTGEPVSLPFDQMHTALLEGKVGFKKGEEIPVVSPDGKTGTMPAENINTAIAGGFRLETPQQQAVRQYVSDNKGLAGTAKVALGQFADEALFGVPEIIYDHTQSSLDIAKKEALKNDHAIANAVGGVAGFGASMFYGGELFQLASKGGRAAELGIRGGTELAARGAEEAAVKGGEKLLVEGGEKAIASAIAKKGEAVAAEELTSRLTAAGMSEAAAAKAAPGLLRSTAASMARYGVEGAVLSAPQTITEAVFDPKEAGEHLAVAIGAGALLGTLGPLGRGFGKLTRGAMEAAPEVFEALRPERLALSAAGIERGSARKLGIENLDNAGRILLKEKLEDGRSVIDGPMQFKTLAERVSTFKTESGTKIGDTLERLDQESVAKNVMERPETGKMISELETLQSKYDEAITRKEYKAIQQIIDTVSSPKRVTVEGIEKTATGFKEISTLSFGETQHLKEMLGDLTKFDHTVKSSVNDVRRQAYAIVRNELDAGVERVAEKIGNPELTAEFQQAKNNYKAASDIDYLLNVKDARQAGNKIFGLTDHIIGGAASGAGIIASMATGNFVHLLWPVLSVLGKKALESTYVQTGAAHFLNKGFDKSGLLFTEQAVKYGANQLDRIPDIFTNSLKKTTPSTLSLSAISRFLGHKVAPESREERLKAFNELSKKINDIVLNQQQTADKLTALATPIGSFGAPKISQAYIDQTIKTFQYLQSVLPGTNKQLNPFKKNYSELNDKDLASFERTLRVVENPYSIIDSIMDNTVTQGQVEVLAAIYPSIYSAMQTKIADLAYSGANVQLPYETRLKLSLLMNIQFDPSIQNVSAYQANFNQPSSKPSRGSSLDIVGKQNNFATPSQKMQMK